MARGVEGDEIATPKPTPKSSKPSSSQSSQKTLLGFFQKQAGAAPEKKTSASSEKPRSPVKKSSPVELTPAPSSDGPEMSSPSLPSRVKPQTNGVNKSQAKGKHGLPSPASSAITADGIAVTSSPSRKVHFLVRCCRTSTGMLIICKGEEASKLCRV